MEFVLFSTFLFHGLLIKTNAQDDSVTTNAGDPCVFHDTINDNWRLVNNTATSARCDTQLSPGWYKMTIDGQIAGIPHVCIKGPACGVQSPVHIEFRDGEPFPGETKSALACGSFIIFGRWSCCALSQEISVKHCGDFYVYYLTPLQNCNTGFCTKRTTDSVESFTAKTREAASVVSVTEHDCDSCGSYQSTGNVLRHSVHPRDLTTLQDLECTDGYLPCADNGGCYPIHHRCDSTRDCSDLSDEMNCQAQHRCPEGLQKCSGSAGIETFHLQSSVTTNSPDQEVTYSSTYDRHLATYPTSVTENDPLSNLNTTTNIPETKTNDTSTVQSSRDVSTTTQKELMFTFLIRGHYDVTSLKPNKARTIQGEANDFIVDSLNYASTSLSSLVSESESIQHGNFRVIHYSSTSVIPHVPSASSKMSSDIAQSFLLRGNKSVTMAHGLDRRHSLVPGISSSEQSSLINAMNTQIFSDLQTSFHLNLVSSSIVTQLSSRTVDRHGWRSLSVSEELTSKHSSLIQINSQLTPSLVDDSSIISVLNVPAADFISDSFTTLVDNYLMNGFKTELFTNIETPHRSSPSNLQSSFPSDNLSNVYTAKYLQSTTQFTSVLKELHLSYSTTNLPNFQSSYSNEFSTTPTVILSSSLVAVVTNENVTMNTPTLESFEDFFLVFIIILISVVILLLGIFTTFLCIRRKMKARTWACRQEGYFLKCEKDLLMKANSPRKSFSIDNPIKEEEMLEDENQMTEKTSLHLSLDGLNINSFVTFQDYPDRYVVASEEQGIIDHTTKTEDTQF